MTTEMDIIDLEQAIQEIHDAIDEIHEPDRILDIYQKVCWENCHLENKKIIVIG